MFAVGCFGAGDVSLVLRSCLLAADVWMGFAGLHVVGFLVNVVGSNASSCGVDDLLFFCTAKCARSSEFKAVSELSKNVSLPAGGGLADLSTRHLCNKRIRLQ